MIGAIAVGLVGLLEIGIVCPPCYLLIMWFPWGFRIPGVGQNSAAMVSLAVAE